MKNPLVLLALLGGALASHSATLGPERDAAVRVQIFLDQKMFGPGFIDGKPGTFTAKAMSAYNKSIGRPEDDLNSLQEDADAALSDTYITAEVPHSAKRFVQRNLPYKREEQAKEKALVYRSYHEFMAERFHTSEDVLYELNGRKTTWAAVPGKTLIVPNVTPFKVEDIQRGRSYQKDEELLSKRHVIIDTVEKQIHIYHPVDVALASAADNAVSTSEPLFNLVASFPTTPGQERFIHRGTWTVRNTVEWPTWRYDKKLLTKGKRSKEAFNIPGGPNNPVGVLWLGLSKSGIGIHGTDNPRTIGRTQSSGCYRLANWDAIRLPQVIRPGATVVVK